MNHQGQEEKHQQRIEVAKADIEHAKQPSSIIQMDLREQIARLKYLVQSYDTYLKCVVPLDYHSDSIIADLHKEAAMLDIHLQAGREES